MQEELGLWAIALGRGLELHADAGPLKLFQEEELQRELPRQPIRVMDEHDVEQPTPDGLTQAREGRPVQVGARGAIVDELAASRDRVTLLPGEGLEFADLGGQSEPLGLVLGADTAIQRRSRFSGHRVR